MKKEEEKKPVVEEEPKKKEGIFTRFRNWLNRSGMFSRILVIFCLGYCVRITEWSMRHFELYNTEAPTLVSCSLALFGGELLLLCVKRVFAKSDNKTIRDVEKEIDGVSSNETTSTVIERVITTNTGSSTSSSDAVG